MGDEGKDGGKRPLRAGRVCPHLLDPFPPLRGGNAAGFMLGDVDDMQGIAGSLGLVVGPACRVAPRILFEYQP